MTQAPPQPAKGVVRPRMPRSRCHACGAPEVIGVCCHCHRLLCRKHDGVANPVDIRGLLSWLRRRPDPPPNQVESGTVDAPAEAGAAATPYPGRNPEPAPSADRLSKRHFCRDCMPIGRPYDAEMVAAAITLGLGVLTGFSSLVVGGVLTTVGGLRILRRLYVARRQRSADRGKPPRLHLDPRIRKLAVVEILRATAHLDAPDSYRAKITEVHGQIRVEAAWGRTHWAQLSDHRRRYRIPEDDELSFWAGSLVVRGPADLVLSPVDPESVEHSTTVVLRSSTAEHAVLRPPGEQGDPQRLIEIDYKITEPEDGWTVPVWLTPTIVPESDRHALELEVQWRACGPDDDGLEIKDLELLRISVPAGWGEVEDFTGAESVTISAPSGGRRDIEWKKPPVKRESRGCWRLAILFEGQIDVEDKIAAADHVTGLLKARFSGAVSGAENVDLYSAGGERRKKGTRAKPTTLVELDFDLSLAGIRYQDVRRVPDQDRSDNHPKPEEERFEGVVPDYRTVALLTNTLSDEGYYVKRVVENPPQPGMKAGVLNRFWDIAGRLYDGVYPIDFHLVLTGEEVHDGPSPSGTTTVGLTVRGTYATTAMEEKVVREWDQLWRRIKSGLEAAVSEHPGASRAGDLPIGESSKELARLRDVAVSVQTRLDAAVDDGGIAPEFAAELINLIEDEFGLGGSTPQK
jgi:hypothetical protein